MSHEATCQFCGDKGMEEDGDIMLNTCPKCFDQRVGPVYEMAQTVPELIDGLVRVGCRREIAEQIVREQFS